MRNLGVLIKPVSGACNMRCSYCFYVDEMAHWKMPKPTIMQPQTLTAVIQKTLAAAHDSCTFGFQGGEPTLAGLPFFRHAAALQHQYNGRGLPIHNMLQTNGLLIDDAWADFLAEQHYLVGVSLDGPPALHDSHRRDWAGANTSLRVEHAVTLLRSRGVQTNVLSVVTANSASSAAELYRYYKQLGLRHQQYIPCLAPLLSEKKSCQYAPSGAQYGQFLIALFDCWYADRMTDTPIYIRYFENILSILAGMAPESCGLCGRCTNQHVVESDGNVYPCDFYVMDDHCLGNLCTDSFQSLSRRQSEIGFIASSMQVAPQCAVCSWRRLCGGGCRRDRQGAALDTLVLNRLCAGYVSFFTHAVPQMQNLLSRMAQKDVPGESSRS